MIITIFKGLLFAFLLVYAAVSDMKRREVDDWVWVSILIVSLVGSGGSFLGAVITALPFFIAAVFPNDRMGGGDFKLMFACGAVLGVWGGIAQIIIGLSLGVLVSGIYCLLTKRNPKETAIPLAPFLCAGGIAAFIITNMGGM